MKIRLMCQCGNVMEFDTQFKGEKIVCQNCGYEFPNPVVSAIKKIFSGSVELNKALFNLDGIGFEIVPENND